MYLAAVFRLTFECLKFKVQITNFQIEDTLTKSEHANCEWKCNGTERNCSELKYNGRTEVVELEIGKHSSQQMTSIKTEHSHTRQNVCLGAGGNVLTLTQQNSCAVVLAITSF